jgi:hypothetical protein
MHQADFNLMPLIVLANPTRSALDLTALPPPSYPEEARGR